MVEKARVDGRKGERGLKRWRVRILEKMSVDFREDEWRL